LRPRKQRLDGAAVKCDQPCRRPPATLPRRPRDLLAELILEALHDADARRALGQIADGRSPLSRGWIGRDGGEPARALRDRAECAAAAVASRPVGRRGSHLRGVLADAAALFDAGLYFEVHDLLEPRWMAARGADRALLQGLIQIAVGYQHRANGNLKGARLLLEEGSAKISNGRLGILDLAPFGGAVWNTVAGLDRGEFDWTLVPSFPREG